MYTQHSYVNVMSLFVTDHLSAYYKGYSIVVYGFVTPHL